MVEDSRAGHQRQQDIRPTERTGRQAAVRVFVRQHAIAGTVNAVVALLWAWRTDEGTRSCHFPMQTGLSPADAYHPHRTDKLYPMQTGGRK